jgi:predicted neuraminidase
VNWKRSLPLIIFAAALAWCWPRLRPLPPAAFVTINLPASPAGEALRGELLPRAGTMAHAATLAQLADGKLIAAWFAGSREGAGDVAIFSSVYDQGAWSAPEVIVDRQRVEHDTQRLIGKLGNPLLWRDAQNVLHLWFVSASYGGWSGSAINHMQSSDDGRHWSAATRIVTSPFWNLSTLVRNPPVALADGGMALPSYHEFLYKRPEWLRFDRNLLLIGKARIPDSARTLQPAVAVLDQHRALALLRDSGPPYRIHAAYTDDAGGRWQPAVATSIPNPDSALALLHLADGTLLLACNPSETNRSNLVLLRSRDQGRSWSAPMTIEQGVADEEFSYPALIEDSAGTVHLAYTWKRQTIKHVELSPAQIEALR